MGTPVSGYDRPIFPAVGLLESDVSLSSTPTFYDELVANGQPVEMHVYPDQGHGGTVYAAPADSTPFPHRAFDPH
jgi:acetyl esterase/lipase